MLSWGNLRATTVDDAARHWQIVREQGLDCPFDVFDQVFREHFGRSDVPALTAAVDWSAVSWTEETLSGDALREVYM